MSGPREELEALSRAFGARKSSRAAMPGCPDPGLLFEAASGGLEREQRLKVLDHVSQCAECTEAGRLAMELDARPVSAAEHAGTPQQSGTPQRAGTSQQAGTSTWAARAKTVGMPRFALAASVIVAVGVGAYLVVPIQ